MIAAVGLALAAACSSGAKLHRDGEGPLSVNGALDGGGLSAYAPATTPWRASFGFNVLCVRESGTAVLERVRTKEVVPARSVTPMLRRVTAAQLKGSPRKTAPFVPFYSALGSPPRFTEDYADFDLRGDFTTEVKSAEITQPCKSPRDPTAGFTELVLVVVADDPGARISGYFVDYTFEGTSYTLRVDQTLVLCGNRVRDHGC